MPPNKSLQPTPVRPPLRSGLAGVKEFLSHRGVEFIERDVSQDKDAMKALEELGIMTTPVTVIDGEIVIGFGRPKLEQLLGY